MNCELCRPGNNVDPATLILQPSGYYLCPAHVASMAARQGQAKPVGIIMDEAELKGLRAEGLISMRFYVYMALRIDGIAGSMKSVQILEFCQKWAVTQEEFITEIAALSKKGIVSMRLSGLEAQAITHKERLKNMEKAHGAG
jgi:hypothetical protein